MDPDNGPTLQSDIAEQITHLLQCEATLKALRVVSHEWKGLATSRIRTLKPRAGQRGGALDLAVLAERFPYVETLDLRSVSGLVRDDCLISNSKMRKLRAVVLDGCKNITNEGLKHLHTSLQSLSLRHCSQITWAGLRALSALPNLTALNIAGIKLTPNPGPADIVLPNPVAAAPGADDEPLALPADNFDAADAVFDIDDNPILATLLPRLVSLTLGDPMALSFMSDQLVIQQLAAAAPTALRHLDLSGCIDLTDWAVHEVCTAAPALTSLSLQSCVRLTSAALPPLGRLRGLAALNLRGCLQMNDSGLAAGLSGLGELQELNLQGCTSITGACLSELSAFKSLTSLNLSHCASFACIDHLRPLSSLRRLALCHCAKLGLGQLSGLTALSGLTEVRASHLRYLIPPAVAAAAPSTTGAAATAADNLSCLTSLQHLAVLDLSYYMGPGGVPRQLLEAVSSLIRLTRLCLAGCGGAASTSSAPPSSSSTSSVSPSSSTTSSVTSASSASSLGGLSATEGSGLAFLCGLRQLQELDLAAWQEADPQELSCLASATSLRRLVVSRLGNRHANACFDGCDCNGSPVSSLYGSPCDSPERDVNVVPAAVPAAGLAPRAAAAAAAEVRAAATRGSAVAEALMAAATTLKATSGSKHTSSLAASDASSRCGSEASQDGDDDVTSTPAVSSPSYSAGSASQPSSVIATSDTAASGDSVAAAAAATVYVNADASPDLDSLTTQMAVGLTFCLCIGNCGCGKSCGSGGAAVSVVKSADGLSTDETPVTAPSTAAVVTGPVVQNGSSGEGDSFVNVLDGMPPVLAPRPSLEKGPLPYNTPAMVSYKPGCSTVPPLPPMPLTLRPGLDGALGHLTSLTALTEIHLEACNHITDIGVERLARLPRLELLDLGGCNRVTGRTLGSFATHGSLHTLLLANCVALCDAGLTAAGAVGSLRVVDVSGCGRLSDAGTVTLGSLRRLSRLSLRGNSKCSDRTVESLAEVPALQWLSLSLCGSLTDASLTALAASTSLTWLDVSHCWRLSRAGVRQLEADRPQLKVIHSGRQ